MAEGLVYLLIGPSGSGKSVLMKAALEHYPSLKRYTTHTTRQPRPGEQHGREYHFVSREEFTRLQAEKILIGCQDYAGELYGSSVEKLEAFIKQGQDGIAAYDVFGALELMAAFPDNIVTIFILPPSTADLRERLIERYGHLNDESQKRLRRMEEEIQYIGHFKYAIENVELQAAINDLLAIIRAEQCARHTKIYSQPPGQDGRPADRKEP